MEFLLELFYSLFRMRIPGTFPLFCSFRRFVCSLIIGGLTTVFAGMLFFMLGGISIIQSSWGVLGRLFYDSRNQKLWLFCGELRIL